MGIISDKVTQFSTSFDNRYAYYTPNPGVNLHNTVPSTLAYHPPGIDPSDSSNPDNVVPVNGETPDMFWNMARLTISNRLEDDDRLQKYLKAGWEPVNVSYVGHNLCVVYLKRLEFL